MAPILLSLVAALGTFLTFPSVADCYGPNDADLMWTYVNKVFLYHEGALAAYKLYIGSNSRDTSWTLAQDLLTPEDVWFRRGDTTTQKLVNDFINYFLIHVPPSGWSGNHWNDDLAWDTQAIIRGYLSTGNSSFLGPAQYGNDLVWSRGWNLTCGGGIWEYQPGFDKGPEQLGKESLSTAPNGLTACEIYQATHNATYLERCEKIYDWSRRTLFNTTSGQVYHKVNLTCFVDKSPSITVAGEWIDLANTLWLSTGNPMYYSDAKVAMDFAWDQLSSDGIFNAGKVQSGYADRFARGAGNFVRDNQLWNQGFYYERFVNNANAILTSRRPDLNITWSGWRSPTPTGDAGNLTVLNFLPSVAWLQYTPPYNPSNETTGLRLLVNSHSGHVIGSTGNYGKGQPVSVQTKSGDGTQPQRWRLTTNDADNHTYNLVNLDTWLSLTADDSTATGLSQSFGVRNDNQRWVITSVGTNRYTIVNKVTGLALDGGQSANTVLRQTAYTGSTQQQWFIDTVPAPVHVA